MNNGDKPVHPLSVEAELRIQAGYGHEHCGISKREEFAKAAMQGFISTFFTGDYDNSPHVVAKDAVRYADALLEALEGK